MGFWSKLLPIAASFIPGVGPLVGAGLGAIMNRPHGHDITDGEQYALPGAMDAMNGTDGSQGSFWGRLGHATTGNTGNILGTIGGMARAGAEGREKGRFNEMGLYNARNNADLAQRRFAEESQSDAYKKAMLGALGMNVQDAHFNRPAGVPDTGMTGGLRPSALGTQGRAAAGVLNGQAMKRLTDGEHFDKLPDYKGNALDTILGTAGVLGGGIDDYKARSKADGQSSIVQQLLEQGLKDQQQPLPPAPPQAPGSPAPLTPNVTTSEQVQPPWWQLAAMQGIH